MPLKLHKQQGEGYQKDDHIVLFCDIKALLSNSLNMTSTAGKKVVLLFTLQESRLSFIGPPVMGIALRIIAGIENADHR